MPLHEPSSLFIRGALLRRRCRIAALAAALVAVPALADAQLYQTHADDAAPVPKGMLQLKVTTSWTRFDERFTGTGRRTLADEISTATFGADQLPLLRPAEQALQTLANDAGTRLSFGRLAAESDARIVRTPVALAYGLTRRLSIGFSVPIIQTRRSIALRVNADSSGNVGFVPERLRQTAASANDAVYTGFTRAADSITSLLSRCPSAPTAPGCPAVLANTSDAAAASGAARQFANAIKIALGTDATTALIAPLSSGSLAAQIEARRTALNTSVQRYLGASAGAPSAVYAAATPFSYIDLQGRDGSQGLLQSAPGGELDSLRTTNRLVLGGFTLGAQYLLFDSFATDTLSAPALQTRLIVGGSYRFEPLFPDSATTLGSISPTDGSAVEVRSAVDVIMGRFGGTVVARYARAFAQTVSAPLLGDPEAFWSTPVFGQVQRNAGTLLNLDVTPRLLLGDWFAVNAHYGLERSGPITYERLSTPDCPQCSTLPAFVAESGARTAQRAGFGIRYSTVDAYTRGSTRLPVEVSFMHLETFAGDPGVAKVSRDQIQLRVYLWIRRPAR